jgi:hypothetical protein
VPFEFELGADKGGFWPKKPDVKGSLDPSTNGNLCRKTEPITVGHQSLNTLRDLRKKPSSSSSGRESEKDTALQNTEKS